jgi:hypothetical protein
VNHVIFASRSVNQRPARILSLGEAADGVRTLQLTVGGECAGGFYLREIPADFGRGFQLDKFATDPGSDPTETRYHLHAENGEVACTCKGYVYKDRCKHSDAVRALLELGRL